VSAYLASAQTPQEVASNVRFQLENVEGWLSVNELECARIKADCLLEEAQKLVKALAARDDARPTSQSSQSTVEGGAK
jgi:hypothetical protein